MKIIRNKVRWVFSLENALKKRERIKSCIKKAFDSKRDSQFRCHRHWMMRSCYAIRSVSFGNRRRVSPYIQINITVKYWYGCTNIAYWNFVVLADRFIRCSYILFFFFFSLFYADMSARARAYIYVWSSI